VLKELSGIFIEKIMEELREKNLNPSTGAENRKFIMCNVNFPPSTNISEVEESQAAFSTSESLDIVYSSRSAYVIHFRSSNFVSTVDIPPYRKFLRLINT
jgi:hypothetical protein